MTMGKLQGIKLTPELTTVVDTVLDLPQPDDTIEGAQSDASSDPSASTAAGAKTWWSSPPQIHITTQYMSSPTVTTVKEAKSILTKGQKDGILPLKGVQATKFLIINSIGPTKEMELINEFETALSIATTSSSFSKSSKSTNNNKDPAFSKRLERLRLHDEERHYKNLTTNLKSTSSIKDDDVTVKSMMYATSIGLNMIVAPITFGIFMYFFAGAIFSRFFDNNEDLDSPNYAAAPTTTTTTRSGGGDNNVDIRRVIAGVISGVIMLFIEMILFVIRSHELDASVRKKGRRKDLRANPFGYTERHAARTFVKD